MAAMAVKGIKETQNAMDDAPSAEFEKWLGPELSIINEQLSRIEALVDPMGRGFEANDNRPKRVERRPDRLDEGTDSFDKRMDDLITSFRNEMRSEFAAVHSEIRHLIHQQVANLRERLASVEAKLAAQQG
jgi:hypothetical protein